MGENAINVHGVAAEDLKKSRLAPDKGGQVMQCDRCESSTNEGDGARWHGERNLGGIFSA